MNNNRNNNRRRGRGNNRQQGGGQQLNRIDSRARGNAPQLLEKYKKLAHDAHLNGDRVQAEYYLQFADHYFRVLADARQRQEEQRARRDDRFGEGQPYFEGEEGEFGGESDMSGFDQPYRRDDRGDGNRDGGRDFNRDEPREGNRDGNRDFNRDEGRDRGQREGGRDNRGPRRERADQAPREAAEAEETPARAAEFEPAGGNPFTRDNRAARGGLRPRREREAPRGFEGEPGDENAGIDPALVPPAIGEAREAAADEADAPAPRKRGRPRKAVSDEGGESLEAVNG